MPDLLIELFCEEIPARMQRAAASHLRKAVTDALVDSGLTYEGARDYVTPRRLTLDVRGLTARSADTVEERKGPRVDAPQKAIDGFLRGAGLSSVDDAEVRSDPKKGDFLVAVITKEGRAAETIIAEAMPTIIRQFPWPKSMRWGAASAEPGSLRWVRPLHSILCTFGPETEEPLVIDFEVNGIRSANETCGHRFHAGEPFAVRRFDDYAAELERRYVIVDRERRKEMIATDARNLAFANGIELVEDDGLLDEVAGLVEWPVVLMGEFDPDFLVLPDDVVQLTIRTNQKCFVCRDSATGNLTNRFILVSNIEANDGGAEIARGNGKVVRARLADALHFWNTDHADLPDRADYAASAEAFSLDMAKPLDQRMAKLDHMGVTFHAKLGTQGERVKRIAALAKELAPIVHADPALTERAAHLAKADLTTEIVGEFPELQGATGAIYAERQGENASVCTAIEDHYKPLGPSDSVPSDPIAIAVALADKLDILTGFWAVDEKPTGSKDPYALRRAALGVIRIVLESGIRLPLSDTSMSSIRRLAANLVQRLIDRLAIAGTVDEANLSRLDLVVLNSGITPFELRLALERGDRIDDLESDVEDLLAFFHDRLKVYLRDKGARHDLIDAVLGDNDDDLLLIVRKVESLQKLVESDVGANLLAGTKRALNILEAEEKNDGAGAFDQPIDHAHLTEPAERELAGVIDAVSGHVTDHVVREDYEGAFAALADLRPAVDGFFESVMVNADDPAVRANRLALLAHLRDVTRKLADFSKIAG